MAPHKYQQFQKKNTSHKTIDCPQLFSTNGTVHPRAIALIVAQCHSLHVLKNHMMQKNISTAEMQKTAKWVWFKGKQPKQVFVLYKMVSSMFDANLLEWEGEDERFLLDNFHK